MPSCKAPRIHAEMRRFGPFPTSKVHLDFHNSRHVPRLAEEFDADDFAATLAEAAVDAVVVFAKDMHGYCYYPSPTGPVHPALKFDLLGRQVAACRERGIVVYGYYCTLWDHFLAETRPEWLMVRRDGTAYLPGPGEPPGWTGLCCAHEDLIRLFETQTREILSAYDLDGIWYDMPIPRDGECFCPLCLDQIRSAGLDPCDVGVQRRWQHENHRRFLERLAGTAEQARPGCQVDFNNQGAFGLRDRLSTMRSVDVEALPTAQWGYDYFPAVVRYVRCAGAPAYGMTGRFHGSWADFGGLKEPHQLATEVLAILAQGARVDVGDQMPPSGRLDPAVYRTIGHAFREVRALAPYAEGAVPVAECALLTEGLPLDTVATPTVSGWVKLLQQLHIASDVVESGWDFSPYPLAVVTDGCRYEASLAARLDRHLDEGGRVLVAAKGWGEWLERHGFGVESAVPFAPAYFLPPNSSEALPRYEYAVYGASWSVATAPETLATLGVPLYQRSAERYTSHEQTPFDHDTGLVLAGLADGAGFLGFDAGELTLRTGYWAYRALVDRLLDRLLPNRMVRCDAGPSLQIEVAHQAATLDSPERFLIHLIHWEIVRPGPSHAPYLAKPPQIGPIHLDLKLDYRTAHAVRLGRPLAAESPGHIELPTMQGHEIVVLTR